MPRDACIACGSNNANEYNDIVHCDRCGKGIHQRCYGFPLTYEIPLLEFVCKDCEKLDPQRVDAQEKVRAVQEAKDLSFLRANLSFATMFRLLYHFRHILGLPDLTFHLVERALVAPSTSTEACTLHIALLKGFNPKTSASPMNWHRYVWQMCLAPQWEEEFDAAWRVGLGYLSPERRQALGLDVDTNIKSEMEPSNKRTRRISPSHSSYKSDETNRLEDFWSYFEQPLEARLEIICTLVELQMLHNKKIVKAIAAAASKTGPAQRKGPQQSTLNNTEDASNTATNTTAKYDKFLLRPLEDWTENDLHPSPLFRDMNGWEYFILREANDGIRLCRWQQICPQYCHARDATLRDKIIADMGIPSIKKTKRSKPTKLEQSTDQKPNHHVNSTGNKSHENTNGQTMTSETSDVVDLSQSYHTNGKKRSRSNNNTNVHEGSLLKYFDSSKTSTNTETQNSLDATGNSTETEKPIPQNSTDMISLNTSKHVIDVKQSLEDELAEEQKPTEPWYVRARKRAPEEHKERQRRRRGWGLARFEVICFNLAELRVLVHLIQNVEVEPTETQQTTQTIRSTRSADKIMHEITQICEKNQIPDHVVTSLEQYATRLLSDQELGPWPSQRQDLVSALQSVIDAYEAYIAQETAKQRKVDRIQDNLARGVAARWAQYAFEGELAPRRRERKRYNVDDQFEKLLDDEDDSDEEKALRRVAASRRGARTTRSTDPDTMIDTTQTNDQNENENNAEAQTTE